MRGMLPEPCDPKATGGPVVDPSHSAEHIAAAFTRVCRTCALAYRCGNEGRTGLADIRVKAAEAPRSFVEYIFGESLKDVLDSSRYVNFPTETSPFPSGGYLIRRIYPRRGRKPESKETVSQPGHAMKKKRILLSPEGRGRIAEAANRRWATGKNSAKEHPSPRAFNLEDGCQSWIETGMTCLVECQQSLAHQVVGCNRLMNVEWLPETKSANKFTQNSS